MFVLVQGKLTASAVGQIVGLQSEEIKLIASEYAGKVSKTLYSCCTQPAFCFYSGRSPALWNKKQQCRTWPYFVIMELSFVLIFRLSVYHFAAVETFFRGAVRTLRSSTTAPPGRRLTGQTDPTKSRAVEGGQCCLPVISNVNCLFCSDVDASQGNYCNLLTKNTGLQHLSAESLLHCKLEPGTFKNKKQKTISGLYLTVI